MKRRSFLGCVAGAIAAPFVWIAGSKTKAEIAQPSLEPFCPPDGFDLSPNAFKFARSRHLRKAFQGGFASGKTTAGSYNLVSRCAPGRQYLVIAPNFPTLQYSTHVVLRDVSLKMGIWNDCKFSRSNMTATFKNDAVIYMRSADAVLDTFYGFSVDGIWIDEASSVSRAVYECLVSRLRPNAWVALTFTPQCCEPKKPEDRWLTEKFLRDWFVVKARITDNIFIDKQFAKTLTTAYRT